MGVAARIFDNVVGLILNCNGFGFFNVYWSTQGTEQNSYTHKSSNIDHFDSETHDFREGSNDPLGGPLRNRCFLKYRGTPNYLNGAHFSIETHGFKEDPYEGGRSLWKLLCPNVKVPKSSKLDPC
jgi:hypothetical protein